MAEGDALMGTTSATPSQIFAYDRDGYDIIVGDKVRYNRALYEVEWMEHEVSGDGYYTETVYLLLRRDKTGKQIVVEDNKVELLN
jgi:hypothetical protein